MGEKTVRATLILGTLLISASATSAEVSSESAGQAQSIGGQAVDPPNLPSDDQLKAWAERYVVKGEYAQTGFDADRVYLYKPASVQMLANGNLLAIIRAELYRPRVEDEYTVRSVRKMVQIDCATFRYRELTVEGFGGSNLQRSVSGLPVSDSWTRPAKEGSPQATRVLEPICTAHNARH